MREVRGDGGEGGREAGPDLSGAAGDLARPLRRRGEKGPPSSRDVRDYYEAAVGVIEIRIVRYEQNLISLLYYGMAPAFDDKLAACVDLRPRVVVSVAYIRKRTENIENSHGIGGVLYILYSRFYLLSDFAEYLILNLQRLHRYGDEYS